MTRRSPSGPSGHRPDPGDRGGCPGPSRSGWSRSCRSRSTPACRTEDRALLFGHHRVVGGQHLATEVGEEQVLDVVLLVKLPALPRGPRSRPRPGRSGLRTGEGALEAHDLLRSGAGERLDEGVEDHGPLAVRSESLTCLPPGAARVNSGAFWPTSRAVAGPAITRLASALATTIAGTRPTRACGMSASSASAGSVGGKTTFSACHHLKYHMGKRASRLRRFPARCRSGGAPLDVATGVAVAAGR